MKATLKTLSLLVSIFSLVSFVQHFIETDLYKVAGEALEYYRSIAYFFIGLPARLFGFSFPQELMDFWTLSFIASAAYVKTKNIENSRMFRNQDNLTSKPHWKVWLFFIFGISGMGLAVLLWTVSIFTYTDAFNEEPQDLSRGTVKNLALIFGGAIAFFLLNGLAPSV